MEVFNLIAWENRNNEIADTLVINDETVSNHIFSKLRAQAIMKFI